MTKQKKISGFTLIEVLIALAVIAIALTALIKATSYDITYTQRVKDRTIGHWVAIKGVRMIQLGLINMPEGRPMTQVTTMFNQKWFWRATPKPSPIKNVREFEVTVSRKQSGPFLHPLIAYRLEQ